MSSLPDPERNWLSLHQRRTRQGTPAVAKTRPPVSSHVRTCQPLDPPRDLSGHQAPIPNPGRVRLSFEPSPRKSANGCVCANGKYLAIPLSTEKPVPPIRPEGVFVRGYCRNENSQPLEDPPPKLDIGDAIDDGVIILPLLNLT